MASIQYVVTATDAASAVFAKIGASADGLDKQLADLSKRIAAPEVDLKDAKFTVGMINAAKRLDRLSAMVADPKVTVDTSQAQMEILRVNAMLDRLGGRRVDVGGRGGFRGIVGGLFSGGTGGFGGLLAGAGPAAAGGAGAAAPAALPLIGGLSPVAIAGIAAGAVAALTAGAAGIIPVLAAAGAGVVAFGALAIPVISKVAAGFSAITSAKTPAALKAAWAAIPAWMRPLEQGLLGLNKQFDAMSKALRPQIFAVFNEGLKIAATLLPDLLPFAKAAGTAIDGLLKGFEKFAASPGFKTFRDQLLKLTGPAIITLGEGLGQITIAVGKLLVALINPNGLKILRVLLEGTALAITGLADAFTFMTPLVIKFFHEMAVQFDDARHRTAADIHNISDWIDALRVTWVNTGHALEVTANAIINTFGTWRHAIAGAFDDVRHAFATVGHDVASAFDSVRHFQGQFDAFGKDIGVIRHVILSAFDDIRHGGAIAFDALRHAVAASWDQMHHDAAGALDNLRHAIGAGWNAIWGDTRTSVKGGIDGVVNYFRGLPGRALASMIGFGHSLYGFGRSALGDFLSGMKSIAGAIFSWIGNFVSTIWNKVKKFFGISSPSSLFYDVGKNLMLGLFHGIRDHAHTAANAASAVARQVSAAGSGVQRWAPLVSQALRMEGLSAGLAGNVLYQMQTESGGNPNAINLNDINAQMGDPSRGLMQTIMSTFQAYHWPGTSWNIYNPLANIAAALNYARHVYGPTLMSGGMGIGSGHGYAAGSWNVPYTGPALVHAGEMIIPAAQAAAVRAGGAGGGNVYNFTITLPPGSDREQGRRIVSYIRSFEKGSGAGWRS